MNAFHMMLGVCCCTAALALFCGNATAGDLRSSGNRFDYVIVTPSAYSSRMQDLADFRQTHDGLRSIVVPFDSILTQFGAGTSPDSALRGFIGCALSTWGTPRPRYFLLAGNIDAIPSHFEPEQLVDPDHAVFDSLFIDQWFIESDRSGEGESRVLASIGRLPAWDSAGIAGMVSRILEYERMGTDTWSGRALCLADYQAGEGDAFEHDALALGSALARGWPDTVTVHMREDSPLYRNPSQFRSLWSEGAAVVAYCGHASPGDLSSARYFTCCDVDSLCNGLRLPLALLGGCDLRFDGDCHSSIPVHLLSCGSGGAIAVVASEGLIYESDVESFLAAIIGRLAGFPGTTAGEAFVAAKNDAGNPFILRRYTFLGDPALHIKQVSPVVSTIPPPDRPGSFALDQNYPNPFNSSTTISYLLPRLTRVTLGVYDVLGRRVAMLVDAEQPAGPHRAAFDGTALGSGAYYVVLRAGESVIVRRSILLK